MHLILQSRTIISYIKLSDLLFIFIDANHGCDVALWIFITFFWFLFQLSSLQGPTTSICLIVTLQHDVTLVTCRFCTGLLVRYLSNFS